MAWWRKEALPHHYFFSWCFLLLVSLLVSLGLALSAPAYRQDIKTQILKGLQWPSWEPDTLTLPAWPSRSLLQICGSRTFLGLFRALRNFQDVEYPLLPKEHLRNPWTDAAIISLRWLREYNLDLWILVCFCVHKHDSEAVNTIIAQVMCSLDEYSTS